MTDNQKLGPPPVEPMSDVSWARVERGLWSRIDSGATDVVPEAPRRRWLWIAVPTLAVAAVAAILVGTGMFSSHEDAPAIAWDDPSEPSRVVAGLAPTAVSFGDAHIDLSAQSAIVMSREGGSPSVLLERGVASFAVAPRADRPPFVVRAGDTVVRVVGTRFVVSRSNELITVAVEHGLVDVQFRGTTKRVGAGETWSSEAPQKVALHSASGAPDTLDDTTTNTMTPDTGTNAPNTTLPDTTPDTATNGPDTATPETGATTPDTGATTRTVTPDTRAKTDTRTVTPDTRAKTDTRTATPDTRATTTTRTPAIRSGSATPAIGSTVAKDADRASYDRLSALERRDSKAALTGYLELSRGNSKWSAVALFAAGRLAADLDDRRAATFLDIYLRRFPNGANADDARNLLSRLKGDAP